MGIPTVSVHLLELRDSALESPKPVGSKVSERQSEAWTLNCEKISWEIWLPYEALSKGLSALPRYHLAFPMAFPFTEKWDLGLQVL